MYIPTLQSIMKLFDSLGYRVNYSEAMEALANLSQSLNDGYAPRMKISSYGGIENKAENYHGKKAKGHGGS